MPATEITPTIKPDLTLLQLHNVLDPKRDYREYAKPYQSTFRYILGDRVDIDGTNGGIANGFLYFAG